MVIPNLWREREKKHEVIGQLYFNTAFHPEAALVSNERADGMLAHGLREPSETGR